MRDRKSGCSQCIWSAGRPHSAELNDDEPGPTPTAATSAPGQLTAHFPPADIAKFRAIAEGTLVKVQAGDQNGAKARITDLETAWDDDESHLKPMDKEAWGVVDRQIDSALKAVRTRNPDPATETQALNELLADLR